jgi:putative tryptophan/tyrosine transport system substrate-binding protein
MKIKTTALTLSALLFALCWSAEAQQVKKVFRIGYLSTTERANDSIRAEGIRAALRELGYIDGQNIAIEYRYVDSKLDRLSELATDLVGLNVDLILVAGGDTAILPAKNATNTIPLILTGSGSDPVKAGFVQSLARPGGNVTGITSFSTDLGGKRLEIIKEAVPKVARIAVLYDPTAPGGAREVKEDLTVPARALGLTIRAWEVRDAVDLDKVFAALTKERADGLYARSGGPGMRPANEKRIVHFALKRRLPSMYGNRRALDVGGFMYYGADVADNHRRVAYYVDRILKGAKPADLPVEQPTKFEFVINLKTAKQIGLTIPPDVLARATKIIR